MNIKLKLLIGSILLLLLSPNIYAGNYTIPKTYNTGETLSASDLNTENTALKAAIDDNDSKVSTNSSNITINAGNISSNTTSISNIPAASELNYVNNNDGAACHILTSSVVNTTSTTISAPSSGFVFVTFSAYGYISHTQGTTSRIKTALSKTSATGTNEGFRLLSVTSSAATDIYYSSINTQQVYPVTSGSTNTYYVNSQMQLGASGSGRLCHFNLTAIFIPN